MKLKQKLIGVLFVLFCGLLSAALMAYINHFYDITNFYLLFVIPIGAIILGLLANTGVVFSLLFLKKKEITYNKFFVIIISAVISLVSYWLSQYINYSNETIITEYTVSRIPPPEIDQTKEELKQIKKQIQNLYSSIKNSSTQLETIKNKIKKIEQDKIIGIRTNQKEYKDLVSQHDNLYSEHNKKLWEIRKLEEYYQRRGTELNYLIDCYNRGIVGKQVVNIKKEPVSKKYKFFDYVKKKHKDISFKTFGVVIKKLPLVPVKEESSGIALLLVKQIGLFFALPISSTLWLNRKKKNKKIL